jgi:RHS repeat-associated protein
MKNKHWNSFSVVALLLIFFSIPTGKTRGLDLSGTLSGAGGIGGLLARQSTVSGELPTVFYHQDAGGNVTALADAYENIAGRYAYGPFGKLVGMSGGMANPNVLRFSGKPYNPFADDYDLGFRRYRTDLPGFITADPIGK